jgi:hypothetical protein
LGKKWRRKNSRFNCRTNGVCHSETLTNGRFVRLTGDVILIMLKFQRKLYTQIWIRSATWLPWFSDCLGLQGSNGLLWWHGLRYAKKEFQFDKPIAGTYLQQKKIGRNDYTITKTQLTERLGVLKWRKATTAQISMAKEIMSIWRFILPAKPDNVRQMGITGVFDHASHDIESVITYEGTRYSFADYRNGYYWNSNF